MIKPKKKEELNNSPEMNAVEGTVDINIPVEDLWECFSHPNLWNEWNECFGG